jgi:hypothetical protein
LNTLPVVLRSRRLLIAKMQQAASRARSSAAATTEPMTMPAMAPLESSSLFEVAAVVPALVADEVGWPLEVEVGSRVGLRVNWGRTTSWQRPVASEPMQQELVEFSELARQKSQSPCKLGPNPQLSGSFSAPVTQPSLNESAGRAQLVKSARICSM